MHRGRGGRALALMVVAGLALAAPCAQADDGATAGLPAVASGHRPGPDVLYAPPPRAPQLENTGVWKAPPILVSGASAYRDGEFLYQDFLFDDHGAEGIADPTDPQTVQDYLYSRKAGTVTYPTGPAFVNDAADLVELRVRPLPDATAFRVTLNALKDPSVVAFTIALGDSGEEHAWPHGAGVRSPAALFLTVHGDQADLLDATTGAPLSPAPAVTIDLERRQIEVRVPHAAWDPGRSTVRMEAGTGLWDRAAGTYLKPGAIATATTPGGGAPTGAAIFNLAFRYDEPMPKLRTTPPGSTMGDAAVGAALEGNFWREKGQAEALFTTDVSHDFADVDFAKLLDDVDDESRVPQTGPMDRIMASRFSFGQGVDYKKLCGGIANAAESAVVKPCDGSMVGQLQPYALYVPRRPQPAGGWGLDLLMHSLSANYNQYLNSRNQSEFGETGAGALVVTPAGRGPDGFYTDVSEADAFEAWADVARHYRLDPDRAVASGYSMGGFGTYRLMARYPDLFSRGQPTVGSGGSLDLLPSLRNTPIMTWNAAADELDNITMSEQSVSAMTKDGLRFESFLFPVADHLTLAENDEWGPAAAFLADDRVDRDPAHVTYVVAPGQDSTRAGVVGDHAYWLSGLTVRAGAAKGATGTIDAVSEAFGQGDPKPSGVSSSLGTLQGGGRGPMPYVHRIQRWGPVPQAPPRDELVVRAANVATAVVDARRARLSCAPTLDVQADGPLDLRIDCPARAASARRCTRTLTLALPRVQGRRAVRVVVTRGTRRLALRRGRDLRVVRVPRPTRRAFALRIRVQTAGGRHARARTVTVVRRYPACR